MARITKLPDSFYKYGEVGYWLFECLYRVYISLRYRGSDRSVCERKYKRIYGVKPDLDKPKTLNEKLLWLKLHDRRSILTLCADKYTVRDYLSEKFGSDHLIPLFYETTDWRDITIDVLPDEPCVVKASHTSGDYRIIRDKSKVDINKLRYDCRIWLHRQFYKETQEWQYKDSTPRIIIEKLLVGKDGHIPNDYKLHYINGELQFIYCSVGRETENKRNIYDANWKPLYFTWAEPQKDTRTLRGKEIEPPKSLGEMKKYASVIAKDFPYVRVDFYDVDGDMYFGEVTLCHGSGFDVFTPREVDLEYGNKLILPTK